MNEYKVTFHNNECDKDDTVYVTARTENEATRSFKQAHKGDSAYGDIWSVELHRENVPATKQQEREALETIKKLLADLGPGSYLGTAFEGCIEDAESNIENDFGDSMKERWESAKQDADYFKSAAEHYAAEKEKAEKEIEALRQQIEALRQQILSPDDLTDCLQLLDDKACEDEERLAAAAARIVELADNPNSPDFAAAVSAHRNAKGNLTYYKALRDRLNAIRAGM